MSQKQDKRHGKDGRGPSPADEQAQALAAMIIECVQSAEVCSAQTSEAVGSGVVREYLVSVVGGWEEDAIGLAPGILARVESPIEALYAIGHLETLFSCRWEGLASRPLVDLVDHGFDAALAFPAIHPQAPVRGATGHYRTDFLLETNVRIKGPHEAAGEYASKLCVECDGHEYHSSREQIAHDNARTRDLLAGGCQVVRFSGSEIYADPAGCAAEALRLLHAGLPSAEDLVTASGVVRVDGKGGPAWVSTRGFAPNEVASILRFVDRAKGAGA